MYLFKTSGKTFESVIFHQKHAFVSKPKNWYVGELVLVSKNKTDCAEGEKQIQYTMELQKIRPLYPRESEKYWPGTEGRWKYLFICTNTKRIRQPFNLEDVIGDRVKRYAPVVSFKKIEEEDRVVIQEYLLQVGYD